MEELNEVFESVAKYFSLLSDPTRLRIMHSICQDEKSVNAIADEVGATQPNVSRHLGMLYQAGVLARRREGSQMFYRVSDSAFTEICRTVCIRVAGGLEGSTALKRRFRNVIQVLG